MENRDQEMAFRALKMKKLEKEILLLDKQLMWFFPNVTFLNRQITFQVDRWFKSTTRINLLPSYFVVTQFQLLSGEVKAEAH